jgi:hypothetical protein
LKHIQPLWDHQHICTSPNKCPTYLENTQPLVLVCTIHSLARGINDLVIKKQFQEERRIHVLTTTQRVEKKQGLISHEQQNQKFAWKSLGAIKSRKKNFLIIFFVVLKTNIEQNSVEKSYEKFFPHLNLKTLF